MYDAGVTLTLGSDSGTGTIPTGWGSDQEMRLLVEAGIPFGTIEPGKTADLILLDTDPTEDITNTLKISRVMQSGKWVDRSPLGAD